MTTSPSSTLPETMPCVEITTPGGPEVLRVTRRPLPYPGPGQVVIQVAAAGVNRPDVIQREGLYPPPPGTSDLPGLEVAGTVVAAGPEVTTPHLGETVCALLAGGGYAGYAVAEAGCCLPVPPGLSLPEAAALPETHFTVWDALFRQGHMRSGESLLVHAGASGIGATALQMAGAFGIRTFATAGSEAKVAFCHEQGAERVVNRHKQDFLPVIKEATDGRGVDMVLDVVGGPALSRNLKVLAPDGRLAILGFLGGVRGEADLRHVVMKRLRIFGTTLRTRSVAEKAALAEALKAQVWPRLGRPGLTPAVFQTFPLAAAAEAHRLMESGEHQGKIVLITADFPS